MAFMVLRQTVDGTDVDLWDGFPTFDAAEVARSHWALDEQGTDVYAVLGPDYRVMEGPEC